MPHFSSDPLLAFVDSSVSAPFPAYVEHFGLVESPFDPTIVPRLVFVGRSHSTVQAQMTEAIMRCEGLILLTGESGTGKTTLCHSMIQSLRVPVVVSNIVDPLLSYEDLLKQALVDFGVSGRGMPAVGQGGQAGSPDLVSMLNRFLQSMAPGSRAIITLDDAHLAQPAVLTELRKLANLQTASGKVLQMILIGQPVLESLLERPEDSQLEQRIARWCRLHPLMMTEVEPYVRHRLSVVGQAANPEAVISPPAMRALGAMPNGTPGALNRLCDRALQNAFEHKSRRVSGGVLMEAAKALNMSLPAPQRRVLGPLALTVVWVAITAVGVGLWGLRYLPARPTEGSSGPPAAAGLAPGQVAGPPETQASAAAAATDSSNSEAGRGERLPAAESYVIIVASFRSRAYANEMVKELTDLGLPAFVRVDGPWSVLVVGPYLTQDEARAARASISSTKFGDARVQKQALPEDPAR